jgi:hypothetical protein
MIHQESGGSVMRSGPRVREYIEFSDDREIDVPSKDSFNYTVSAMGFV